MSNHELSVDFQVPVSVLNEEEIISAVTKILVDHQIDESKIGVIFVNNDYITQLNAEYFNKQKPTDVISFPLSEAEAACLEGEVYICTQVAQEQASEYEVTLENELCRLVIHGVLHLLGYDDLTPPEKTKMTEQEDFYLHYIFASN